MLTTPDVLRIKQLDSRAVLPRRGSALAAGLDVCSIEEIIIGPKQRLTARTGLAVPRLFTGTIDRAPGISIEPIEHAIISSDRPLLAHVDGEPFQGATTLEARVHPAALRVAI